MRQPPHLHPRSRLTSSLFATTLFASFFVVALPHILPCPAPRVAYADDGTMKRRRRRKTNENDVGAPTDTAVEESGDVLGEERGGDGGDVLGRECPIPKPSGLVAQVSEILGFKGTGDDKRTSSMDGKGARPP